MSRHPTSIQRKLTSAIMMTSVTVLLLTGAGFVSYELFTFDRRLERYVGTVGQIIAANSTAAIRFDDRGAARETLSAISLEHHIETAALYLTNGDLFAYWPPNAPRSTFPERPRAGGYHYERDSLIFFLPVEHNGSRIGTLYLDSDLGGRRERFGPYALIVAIVLGVSIIVALLLSRFLQRGISEPLLSLAETAKTISARRDYSARALKFSDDEVGALTDAFNHMLTQIQERDAALRHSEERLRQLANAVPALVWTCDATGGAIYFNEPWYEFTGRSPEDSLGLKWTQALHPEDRDAAVRLWHAAVKEGGVYEAEARFRRFDGEYRWFLSRAHPMRDLHGAVLTWFGTSTDVDEKKRTEEKISQMNVSLEGRVQERTSQLEASNRELEAFSYSVAHDLRAPLRSIDGFNQALLDDFGPQLPAKARELFRRSREASQRMSQLIDDLLNLSRVSRAEMRRQKVNLSEIVSAIATELQKTDPARQANFHIEPGLTATGDERLLRLVMENLLNNAFKFTRKNAVTEICFGSVLQNDQRVLFVRDNGAGFKMEYASKLFGPFQRLHAIAEYPGNGIGLATVHRILLRHGGKIWAEAEEKKGAVFYFTLPK